MINGCNTRFGPRDDGPGPERLQRASGSTIIYIQFAKEHEEEFKILFMPLLGGPKKLSDVPGEGGYRILRQCVGEAIAAGAIRDDDPDLISFYLWYYSPAESTSAGYFQDFFYSISCHIDKELPTLLPYTLPLI